MDQGEKIMKKSQKIIFNRRLREKKNRKMTLVIGAKFKDGVVLVADRKITNPDSTDEQFTKKLKEPYPDSPICFGATGWKNKYDQFNRKILQIAAEHMRETELRNRAFFQKNNLEYPEYEKEDEDKTLDKKDIENKSSDENINDNELTPAYSYTMENFLEDSQNLIRKLCTGSDGTIRPLLEVLTALFSEDGARLHRIDFDGSEEEVDYYAIGSGADYVNLFLKKFWNEEMEIDEILKLAYFCIYYVQDLQFDSGVGIEEGILPDHHVVVSDGKYGSYTGFQGNEKEVINEIRSQVNKFKEIINDLQFKNN